TAEQRDQAFTWFDTLNFPEVKGRARPLSCCSSPRWMTPKSGPGCPAPGTDGVSPTRASATWQAVYSTNWTPTSTASTRPPRGPAGKSRAGLVCEEVEPTLPWQPRPPPPRIPSGAASLPCAPAPAPTPLQQQGEKHLTRKKRGVVLRDRATRHSC